MNGGSVTITATCTACGQVDRVEVTKVDLRRHLEGALVQDVWPHYSPQQREVLISYRDSLSGGFPVYLCQKEWDEMAQAELDNDYRGEL